MDERLEKEAVRLEHLFPLMTAIVPEPDSPIDWVRAWEKFWRHIEDANFVMATDPTIDECLLVNRNHLAWVRFWSVRHPIEEQRIWYRQFLKVLERENEQIACKARAMLRKRGVYVLRKRNDAQRKW
jgi:hypothetical protein